jgi:CheY-like chemotaxis protein
VHIPAFDRMKSNATILLAEDYDDDIALLQRAFLKAEISGVKIVRNGDEIIDYLVGSGRFEDRTLNPLPDLLLIDIKMPRRSGLEVLRWIRGNESTRRLPVVVLTSSQNIRDVNEAYDLGANSYLIKPTDFQELVRLIKAFGDYWLTFSMLPTSELKPPVR